MGRTSRVMEPERIEETDDAGVYADAAAAAYLDRVDDLFVDQVLGLGPGPALVLDVGTGPGQIPAKLASRSPHLSLVALDASLTMLGVARRQALSRGHGQRIRILCADGRALPFEGGRFQRVVSNSVMHHLPDPAPVLAEMGRVLAPGGVMMVGDLCRPPDHRSWFHMLWHGRHYQGRMWRLFRDSVRAAFSLREMRALAHRAGLRGASVVPRAPAHMVLTWMAPSSETESRDISRGDHS